jgi:hypothetical protein
MRPRQSEQAMARSEAIAGAVAFSRRGSPDLGEFEDAVILKTFGDVPDDLLGVGKVTELETDHVFWVGEFGGTFFNDQGANSLFDHSGVRCPGSFDLNFGKKQSHGSGYCIIMGEGSPSDQAFLKWSCDGDTVDCSGTFEYTGGTGRYQSARGSNTLAHSTAKCNGEIFGVEENLARSSVAEYLSGARVEFILDPLDIGI